MCGGHFPWMAVCLRLPTCGGHFPRMAISLRLPMCGGHEVAICLRCPTRSSHFPEVTGVLVLNPEGTVCPVGCDLE